MLIFPVAISIKYRSKREYQEIIFLKNKTQSINKDKNKSNVIIYILIILPRAIFFPFEDAINELLLSDYFLLPQYLMLFRGLIEFAVFSLITIIAIILKI